MRVLKDKLRDNQHHTCVLNDLRQMGVVALRGVT